MGAIFTKAAFGMLILRSTLFGSVKNAILSQQWWHKDSTSMMMAQGFDFNVGSPDCDLNENLLIGNVIGVFTSEIDPD